MTTQPATSVLRRLRDVVRDRLHIEVRRVDTGPPPPPPPSGLPKITQYWEVEGRFHDRCLQAFERTGEGPVDRSAGSRHHRAKLFNLDGLVAIAPADAGLVAEVGCFRGLSAYLLAHRLKDADPAYVGDGFHLFDSFEGLSPPTESDRIDDPDIPVGGRPREAGMFAADVDTVKAVLDEFPAISYHKGWIPACFEDAPDGPFRFVHIDVDLHDPMLHSLEYFHPRLGRDGLIVCDDYGAIRWPGVRSAVDAFAARVHASVLPLSTGQAVLLTR